MAHNGDLFLDEIGEMPVSAQVRLLRVIQEGEVTRIGDTRPVKVNCRIIAGTNQNVEEMIREGRFREDLYHRINVIRINTTPLRERMEDVWDLAKLFTLQIGGPNFKISDQAIRALCEYDWPGNIRELRNAVERAVISARKRKATTLLFEDVTIHPPIYDLSYRQRKIESNLPFETEDLTPNNYRQFIESVEREYFKSALEAAGGSAWDLARRIGLARSTVFKKLKELGLPTKIKIPPRVRHQRITSPSEAETESRNLV
jgi:DNA-binding NtrC family response regulator